MQYKETNEPYYKSSTVHEHV